MRRLTFGGARDGSRGTLRACGSASACSRCSLGALAPGAIAAAASPPGTLAQLAGAGGCASAAGRARLHARARPRRCPRRRAQPRRPLAVRGRGHAGERDHVQRRARERPAAAAQPRRRVPRLGAHRTAAARRARSRAPRRSSSRRTTCTSTWRPPTAGAVTSFARQPNGSLVQLAGVAGCIATTPLTGCSSAHVARRRRRDRDLARRPLRLRRRRLGRLAAHVLARRGHRAPDAARRRRGVPAREPHATARRSRASTRPRRSRSRPTARRSTSPRAPAR